MAGCALARPTTHGESSERNTGNPRIGHERGADRSAVAEYTDCRVDGHSGRIQQFERASRRERRLLGRLCKHGVAGGKRCGDLAGKDCEREIPRADAGEDAASVQSERIALARRARKRQRCGEVRAGLQRVVTAKVGRLAHFRDCVAVSAAAFAHDQRGEGAHLRLDFACAALEHCCALARRSHRPFLECCSGAIER